MPDVVNAPFDHQLYATTTAAAAAATTTSSSCVSDLVYDESDGSESATPDMDSQLLYVKLKEVLTTTATASSAAVAAVATTTTRSTQPCIPPGSLNRVPASAGVRAGMSPLPGGR